ncbi:helicase-related protein [Microcella pacifica]|uniref:Helicase n=1 Tax=Microcella pacifica TaxID=2591847 RepID=A0A9E5MLB9_9MICO|nr:helicase-related protein [Microcella pacifica]NHF63841.1 helicase [Microcella pacifica]
MRSGGQAAFIEYLRKNFVGPRSGDDEEVESNPVYAYLTGMLFPMEVGEGVPPETLDEDLSPDESVVKGEADDGFPDEEDLDQDDIGNLTAASGWTPSSMGLSFMHDSPELVVSIRGAAYERQYERDDEAAGTGDGRWRRVAFSDQSVIIAAATNGQEDVWGGRARLQWRSRPGKHAEIVTVSLSNAVQVPLGRAKKEVESVLFQCEFDVESVGGVIQPYPGNVVVNATPEDRELEYRFRNHLSYAIGHGVAATWLSSLPVTRISTDSLPSETVPRVKPREASGEALRMAWLADRSLLSDVLAEGLSGFVSEYERWVSDRRVEAESAGKHREAALGLVSRMDQATKRMREGILLLGRDAAVREAFQLANMAMRLQSTRGIEVPFEEEPNWRPFQLAFILMALASTAGDDHEDRELVDLIWFPTGGGKTEAYLGLAAFEMIRRRLQDGSAGGGTAVITRYTMRLLTAQQFQRTARLICALELLRDDGTLPPSTPPFSVGLLLGGTTTPNDFKAAERLLAEVRGQLSPHNPFQVRACPWCETQLMPERKSQRDDTYGFRATAKSFTINCVNRKCAFHASLPMQVVDEAIFQTPPTIVVATVDKFARLAWIPSGGSIFGLSGSSFNPPSLIIQDELHLISGPLGTIVGIYEAAIQSLLKWRGSSPKIVASTATIRSADEQVRGLMASRVEVFPPSGLDADDNYFAELDQEGPGRVYVGILPQAFAPAWAIGQAAGRLLAAPTAIPSLSTAEQDAYWTLVAYHNSLRELGRTVTILRDDVRTMLEREVTSNPGGRTIGAEGIEELTSNVDSHELVKILERLSVSKGSPGVIDAIAATNILSVGIDVDRLGLMLVNGQPKTTAEYIQATSRVGRAGVPGIVLTLYRSGKARDRSTFEGFRTFHGSFYRFVEPTSVTPWAFQARRRALRAALVILMRHAAGYSKNDDAAAFDETSAFVQKAIGMLMDHIRLADEREAPTIERELRRAAADWNTRAKGSAGDLKYQGSKKTDDQLLKTFGDSGQGWPTMHSMRSVERGVRLRPRGEKA